MNKLRLLICIATIGISACKKEKENIPEPISGFELGMTSSVQGTVISPLNTSKNATSFQWDLDDGRTSTEQSPTINFDRIGNYKISLTAKNSDGTTSTTTKTLKIFAPTID